MNKRKQIMMFNRNRKGLRKFGKGKKAIGFFSYLIVISAIILFTMAIIKLNIPERNKIIESLNSLYFPIDFKWHLKQLPIYLDVNYNVSHYHALNKFSKNLDNSSECKVIEKNKKKYFSLPSCSINKVLFFKFFKDNFEAGVENYVKVTELYFNTFPEYKCDYKEKIECYFNFKKKFDLGLVNISVNKEFAYDRKINTSLLDEVSQLKEEIREKIKNNEDVRSKNFEVKINEENSIIYITIIYKKFIKPIEFNFFIRE